MDEIRQDLESPQTVPGADSWEHRSDGDALRELAREAIRSGRLPSRRAHDAWGGPGNGGRCAICSELVTADQLELEVEFLGNGGGEGSQTYHLHPRCLAAWEIELRRLDDRALAGSEGDGRMSDRASPTNSGRDCA